jgi:hypothetical protein
MDKTIEVKVEEGQTVYIRTPHGVISYYCSEHHKSLTSYVEDVKYAGFYTEKTTKNTHRYTKFGGKVERLVVVEVKE